MNSGHAIIDALASFGLAFAITAAIMPRAIEALKALRAGQIISRDGPESHLTKQGTPTMGGLVLLTGLLLAVAIVALNRHMRGGLFDAQPTIALMLLIIGFGLLGFLDDYLIVARGKSLGLKARQKLLGQFVLAIAFVGWVAWSTGGAPIVTGIRVPGFGVLALGKAYYVFAVLFIVGMSNAVNLTDGLDGLVSGLSTICAAALATAILGPIVALGLGSGTAMVCAAVAGACLGFLWFNAHPAKIFMGDTGSLALGAGFAGVAILTKHELLLLLLGVVFVAEALSVIIQVISFKTTGKRVFKMSPIHHHFELSGWPEERVVIRFWIVGVLAAALGTCAVQAFKGVGW